MPKRVDANENGGEMDRDGELWRDVVGFEGEYQVSNLGRVKSLERIVMRRNGRSKPVAERLLSPSPDAYGYPLVHLSGGKARKVHRLVAEAFIGPIPPGCWVHHLDSDRSNARLGNLWIVTPSENHIESVRAGTHAAPRGAQNGNAVLTDDLVRALRQEYQPRKHGHGSHALAKKYGVSQSAVSQVIRGLSWRHVRPRGESL